MGILFLLSSGVSGVLSYHCYLAFQYLSIFHQSIRYFDNPLDSARSLSIVPRIDLRIEYSHLLISSPQLHLHVWLIFKCECLSKQEGSNQVRSGQKMFPEGQKSWLSSRSPHNHQQHTRIATSILESSTIYRRIPVQERAKSKHGLRRPTHRPAKRARTSNTHSTSTSRCDNDLHPTNQPHHHALPPSPDNDSQRRRILLHQTHPQRPPRPLPIRLNATLPHPHPAPRLRRCKKSRRQTHLVQKREEDNRPQRCVL